MIDSAADVGARYKVDGFRFDLMGHHMKRNMTKLRDALDALTLEADGVDGRRVYLYGEGWNFGEVADNARGVNATQANMAGTGIGTFNDRLRDGVRGGGPFERHRAGVPQRPLLRPERYDAGIDRTSVDLLLLSDWIRSGSRQSRRLRIRRSRGQRVTGRGDRLQGTGRRLHRGPAGSHQLRRRARQRNALRRDAAQGRHADDRADRVRVQNLGIWLVAFAQGIPFFHAGSSCSARNRSTATATTPATGSTGSTSRT